MGDVGSTGLEQLLAFAGDLVRRGLTCEDLDGDVLQDLLTKHGLLHQAPAAAQDCEQEWALEYGIKPGETIYKLTDLGKAARDAF